VRKSSAGNGQMLMESFSDNRAVELWTGILAFAADRAQLGQAHGTQGVMGKLLQARSFVPAPHSRSIDNFPACPQSIPLSRNIS